MTVTEDGFRATRPPPEPPDHPLAPAVPSPAKVLQLVGSVIAPTTLVTALLFYFGWARTNAQAERLGLDTSILGYSAQDYVLRSISSMYLPLAVGMTMALLCLWGHASVARWMAVDRWRPKLRVLGALMVTVGLACLAAVLLDSFVATVRTNLLAPLCLTGAIGILTYASYLLRRTTPRRRLAARPVEPGWMRNTRATMVGLLLSLALFWSVSDYAGAVGRQLGDRILYGQAGLPAVVLFSPRRLHLDFDGVTETHLEDTVGAYRFRYEGLEFLERTGGRFFLRPSAIGPSRLVIIVIPESDAPQLQFVR